MVRLKNLLRWTSVPNNSLLLTPALITRVAEAQTDLLSLTRTPLLLSTLSPKQSNACIDDEVARTLRLQKDIVNSLRHVGPTLKELTKQRGKVLPPQFIRLLRTHQVLPWISPEILLSMTHRITAFKAFCTTSQLCQIVELLANFGYKDLSFAALREEVMLRINEGSPAMGFSKSRPISAVCSVGDCFMVLRCARKALSVKAAMKKDMYIDILSHLVIKERYTFWAEAGASYDPHLQVSTTFPKSGYRPDTVLGVIREIELVAHEVGPTAYYSVRVLKESLAAAKDKLETPTGLPALHVADPSSGNFTSELMKVVNLEEVEDPTEASRSISRCRKILSLLPTSDTALPVARFIAVYLAKTIRKQEQKHVETGEGLLVPEDWDVVLDCVSLLRRPLFSSNRCVASARLEITTTYLRHSQLVNCKVRDDDDEEQESIPIFPDQ